MSLVSELRDGNKATVVVVVVVEPNIVLLLCALDMVVPDPLHLPYDVKLSIILVNIIKNNGIIAPFAIEAIVAITINTISILDTYRYF